MIPKSSAPRLSRLPLTLFVTIPVTAQLNISGNSTKGLRFRTINNSGTTTWTGLGTINSGVGAVFNNLAGATFDVQNNEVFDYNLGGTVTVFNNSGTFRKTVGDLTTTMDIIFNNTGTIDVQIGTVNFTRGGSGLP